MRLAFDVRELPGDVDGVAVGGDCIDEVVDVGSKARIVGARVGVVCRNVGLANRVATGVLHLGKCADQDDAVANDNAVEHLAVCHSKDIETWGLVCSSVSKG